MKLFTAAIRFFVIEAIAQKFEDIAFAKAIADGEQTTTVPESEVLRLLDT